MQLDACLRSIEAFAPYSGRVLIIYRATTPAFEAGYRSIELSSTADLIEETSEFRQDVLAAVLELGLELAVEDEDDVPARAPVVGEIPGRIVDHAKPAASDLNRSPRLAWDWTRGHLDFGYPMSLDGHVFRTDLLLRLLTRTRFRNPNELEDELHWRRHIAPRWMLASRESSLVSVPLNAVTSARSNRVGGDPAFSVAALNARFLGGERVDLDRLDFSSISAAHQEIPLVFAERSRT